METTLKAARRDDAGKGVARKLRADGRVPGILYGHGMDPISLHVSSQDLLHFFHQAGASVLVDLDVEGESHLAIAREVQRDHIHGRYLHIDFLAVRRDEKIKVEVEVRDTGEAVGVRNGGVIEHHLREVEVECFPTDVPEFVTADVTDLDIGDSLKVADLAGPENVVILTDPTMTAVSVITPAALRTEADLTLPGEEGVEVAEEEAEGAPAPEVEAEAAPEQEGGDEG
jgi:large subunit ribosomal protein L25